MISRSVPLVRFNTKYMINLNEVAYACVVKNDSYPTKWKLKIVLTGMPERSLIWSYDTEPDALSALDRFQGLVDTYVMQEMP